MIYVGFIHFNNLSDRVHELSSVLESYTHTPPTVIRKSFLTLCCSKLPSVDDMDESWENETSVLIGRVFDIAEQSCFCDKNFKNISNLNKEEVLEKIWGKYIYIHVSKEISEVEIVVDSTGQLPFFYYSFPDGSILFSSEIEIIFKVLSQRSAFNWSYLCSYLVYGNSSAIQTPFENIYELPPACYLKITKNKRITKPFWNPLNSYKTLISQERSAVDVLKNTLRPWIEPYKNICVSLSGGLDSSSLVYCLKDIVKEDQTLSALNFFHSSVQSSNELIHARKVCQETGIELIEIDMSFSLPFELPKKKLLLAPNKPFPGLVSLRCLENIADHLPKDDSCSFISGHGSDHIFMRPPSKKSISDYIIEKGLRGSAEKLKNLAHLYRTPLFSILKENTKSLGYLFFARRLSKRNPKSAQKKFPSWINQKFFQEVSLNFTHPIYEHLPPQVLPGKYEQIDNLYEGLASIHMENQVNPTYYPFFYKPLVEFALSFPTYNLFNKGYDRYPLRKAISDRFKTEAVWRRDKGQTVGITQFGIKKNLESVLNLCLEGQFVKQGLIDRERLHQTIMLIASGDIKHFWPFKHLASCEVFFKSWEEKSF